MVSNNHGVEGLQLFFLVVLRQGRVVRICTMVATAMFDACFRDDAFVDTLIMYIPSLVAAAAHIPAIARFRVPRIPLRGGPV